MPVRSQLTTPPEFGLGGVKADDACLVNGLAAGAASGWGDDEVAIYGDSAHDAVCEDAISISPSLC